MMENIFQWVCLSFYHVIHFHQKKHLDDCNRSFNNGQMCSVYAVKFKFTNAKEETVFII